MVLTEPTPQTWWRNLTFRPLRQCSALGFDSVMAAGAETLGGTRPRRDRPLVTRGSRLRWIFARLEEEAFPVAIGALYGVVLLLLMPGELVQDSWATLVAGREIVHHGLPQRETLTVMAQGAHWVDQQWLAQVAFYELFRAGGYRLMLLTHVLLIGSAFGLALVAARRRGASAVSVFLVALLCSVVAPWGWQLRAQSFAPLLFVAVLSLLIEDERWPSRRVFAAIPLLVLWANLHGSVLLGAFLVSLYGAFCLVIGRRRGTRLRAAALLVAAPLAVVCSPYGLSLVNYYRHLLVNPPFAKLVVEWTTPTPRPITALFYLLAFATVWCLGRWGRRLSLFERAALLLTLASALTATRNIVWFGLAALMLLPLLVDEARSPSATGAHPAVRLGLALTSIAGLVAAAAIVVAKPSGWYDHLWHGRAAAAVSAATRDPATRVFASDKYADWLLWREPKLAGRVAFDIRFELNTRTQVRRLYDYFNQIGTNWQAAARGYQVIVLDRSANEKVRLALRRDRKIRETYLDPGIAVLVRTGRAAT